MIFAKNESLGQTKNDYTRVILCTGKETYYASAQQKEKTQHTNINKPQFQNNLTPWQAVQKLEAEEVSLEKWIAVKQNTQTKILISSPLVLHQQIQFIT